MKMFYYIAESSKTEMFTTTLVERFDTLAEAQDFVREAASRWDDEGLRSNLIYNDGRTLSSEPSYRGDGELWGADALDQEYFVRHNYLIFASPIFMGGGTIG